MAIKLPVGDFEFGTGVFRIGDWGFKTPIPNPKTPIPIQNHQFVILPPIGDFHF